MVPDDPRLAAVVDDTERERPTIWERDSGGLRGEEQRREGYEHGGDARARPLRTEGTTRPVSVSHGGPPRYGQGAGREPILADGSNGPSPPSRSRQRSATSGWVRAHGSDSGSALAGAAGDLHEDLLAIGCGPVVPDTAVAFGMTAILDLFDRWGLGTSTPLVTRRSVRLATRARRAGRGTPGRHRPAPIWRNGGPVGRGGTPRRPTRWPLPQVLRPSTGGGRRLAGSRSPG